jgi:hypothetical protein
MSFAKAFGSNVGDTYRRNHDGEWGMITLGENQFAGLRNTSGSSLWPSGRAFDRITTNAEENISDYYLNLLKRPHSVNTISGAARKPPGSPIFSQYFVR